MHLHHLRHYYASGLIAAGCDVVTVQRALGHRTANVTLGTYSHDFGADQGASHSGDPRPEQGDPQAECHQVWRGGRAQGRLIRLAGRRALQGSASPAGHGYACSCCRVAEA